MISCKERFVSFFNNRWLVFVAAMWIQSCAGIGYIFGSISPVIKSSLNYNQKELARLGVAKDLGDSVGFLAGSLCEILPLWGGLLVGAIQNLVGYGWVWLVVTGRAPPLPLWVMCLLIFIGTNGETYFNTAALVSCVQNFPKNRGPVVGILKGFAGLAGAILTQTYAVIHSPDQASLIFMVAVGPTMVVISLMFFIRPVKGHRQIRPTDGLSFSFIYSICILLAAYLMGVMVVEDLVEINQNIITLFTVILFFLLIIPIVIPVSLSLSKEPRTQADEPLLPESQNEEPSKSGNESQEVIFSEVEEERARETDSSLSVSERRKKIQELQSRIVQAAAEGAVRVKRRRGPHRGEEFTLTEALMKADFWLIFFSLLLGSGSGLTVIDNLGQISQSLGYENTHVFVSMISIWNFLGRVGGGYFSEIVVKDYAYPRPVTMAIAQVIMAIGHFLFATGWPGTMYIGTLMVGLGYGAHWAIVPATASELFGIKKFGALYNFLTLANPAGSLVFSGVIASSIYDREAAKQAQGNQLLGSIMSTALAAEDALKCEGVVCFFLTFLILSGLCILGVVLSMILVYRTKVVYAHLYGKSR